MIRAVLLAIAMCYAALTSARGDVDALLDAACRVRSSAGGVGSGCVFEINKEHAWIMTAAHIVEGNDTGTCEFWRCGHQSQQIAYHVWARDQRYDVAVLGVSSPAFGDILPREIRLAAPDRIVAPGEPLTSVGSANGAWATGFRGHALGYSGHALAFYPSPANGRSGSAICDSEGHIVGIVSARVEGSEHAYGLAVPIQAIYAAFGAPQQRSLSLTALTRVELLQCPDGQCSPQPQWYLLPYRFRQQFRQQPIPQPIPQPAPSPPGDRGGGAWPTLPSALTPAPPATPGSDLPPAVVIDLGPLAQPLQGLAESQKSMADAVAAYLQAESRRRAEREAEQKLGGVAADVSSAASALMSGDKQGAADTLGHSGELWAMLAEVSWMIVAPLLGIGAVGYGIGRMVLRSVARAVGPATYDHAKKAVVDWWKDDNDTPEEARAKQRLAEAAAEATAKRVGNGSQATNT